MFHIRSVLKIYNEANSRDSVIASERAVEKMMMMTRLEPWVVVKKRPASEAMSGRTRTLRNLHC
jgi:hypothetical protein